MLFDCKKIIAYLCNRNLKRNRTMCYCNGYSGLAVADYFIEKALQQKKAITNMHVLKMIYFAQAFSYPELKKKLIKDDFYAWKFGPVEINTYEEFKRYGAKSITSISNKTSDELADIKSKKEITIFLDKLCKLFDANPYRLSNLSHVSGGPWYVTPMYQVIEYEKIKSYYGGEY